MIFILGGCKKVEEVKAAKEAARQARLQAAIPQRQQQQNVEYRSKRDETDTTRDEE